MNLFEQRLLAEGVRAIEGDYPALSTPVSAKLDGAFEAQLLARAVALDPQLQISSLFSHFKRLTKHLFILLALFVLLLGASSVQQLFFSEQGTQINFFWAFALFFIPNLVTLFLWGLFFLRPNLLTRGWLARFSLFLLKSIEKRFNPQANKHPHFWILFRCYSQVRFSPYLGRYQLSMITHLLWLSYFLGACLMLVVMLATHQVDFIWQTSILSLSSFQWLTQLLAYLPDVLGFPVPDVEQIQQSHFGVVNVIADAQQSRFVWSSLLISSLFLYGLLPRFCLFLLMQFLLMINRKNFSLNLSNPYYVQLRQQLTPNITTLGVSDPERLKETPFEHLATKIASQPLPSWFYPVAIELSQTQLIRCKKHIKQYLPEHLGALENICDFQTQKALLQILPNIKLQAIVLYVSLSRLPDRGLLSFIKSLTESCHKSFYLLLLDDDFTEPEQLNKRRSDWYALAMQANIPLDNIINMVSGEK